MKKITEESYVETYTRKNGTFGYRTINNDVSMADPTGVEEAEITSIMSNFAKTGRLPLRGGQPGLYSPDEVVPNGKDLLSAVTLVQEATERFEQLPSTLRERFGNDPIKMYDFLSDPKNMPEAVKLGIIQQPVSKNDELNDDIETKNTRTTKTQKAKEKTPEPE
ncbi:internal scaffolding protein [Apis mellifera associated microvirus 27]|nr:internal scaffolding protein [Apis mellifera associated microvirus 27]